MLHINTVHVQRETLWVKQLAGEQYKMICSAWACKHTYIAESFVGLCTHSSVWKVSSAHRGECVTTGGLYRPTHLCVAHFELHKKVSHSFFLWCGKVGGCLEVSGGMVFQRRAGWFGFRLSQPGEKSCWAVWRSGLWCSGTVFLMVGAGRDCGRGPSWCCWFCWSIVQGNVQDGWERGTDDLCSRVHCGLAVSSTAVPVPDSDAAGQHTLNGAPVECGEDGWWETCSFQPAEKV